MEDYKKKYEQALDNFKKIKSANKDNNELVDFIEYEYPELKESEDERIRKEIIRIVDIWTDSCPTVNGISTETLLAWLEKQGELIDKLVKYREWLISKTEQWTEKENDKTNSNTGKHCYIGAANALISARAEFEEIFNYESWLEKQGEQNPTDKVEPKFKVGDVIRLKGGTAEYTIRRVTNTTYYTDGWSYGIERCEEDYELVEQNPTEDNCKISDCDTKVDMTEYNNGYECGKQRVLKYPEDYDLCKKCVWSEEDKKEWNHLIGMLEGWLNTFRETIYKNDCNKAISWLKSLKERVKPQTKQEWTGYDEKAYEIALLDIDKSPSITKNDTIDWLKSLKEKYAWKPSDEQMEALLKLEEMHVLEHEKNQENAHLYMVIKSLKEQLLKLKGE